MPDRFEGYRLLRQLGDGEGVVHYLATESDATIPTLGGGIPLCTIAVFDVARAVDACTLASIAMRADRTGTLPTWRAEGIVDDQRGYLVFDYVPGTRLVERLNRGYLTAGEAVTILAPLCASLAGLAACGIESVDVSARSIIIDLTGRPRLCGLYGWRLSVDAMWPDTVCGQESVHRVNAGVGDESVWSHEAWRHGELPARPDTVWPTAAVSVTASDQGPHSTPATGLTALVLEIAQAVRPSGSLDPVLRVIEQFQSARVASSIPDASYRAAHYTAVERALFTIIAPESIRDTVHRTMPEPVSEQSPREPMALDPKLRVRTPIDSGERKSVRPLSTLRMGHTDRIAEAVVSVIPVIHRGSSRQARVVEAGSFGRSATRAEQTESRSRAVRARKAESRVRTTGDRHTSDRPGVQRARVSTYAPPPSQLDTPGVQRARAPVSSHPVSVWRRLGERRRPVIFAALVGSGALILVLTLVPPTTGEGTGSSSVGDEQAGRDTRHSTQPTTPAPRETPDVGGARYLRDPTTPAPRETPASPETVPASPGKQDSFETSPVASTQTPVAAVGELLSIRTRCLAALDTACIAAFAQPGSPLEAKDRGAVLAHRREQGVSAVKTTQPTPGTEFDLEAATVTADMGSAVLVRVPRKEAGGTASVLLMTSEAGWRLRDIYD
ncbi:MAG: hypothetical protein B5766_06740 [Candidatus Lumbricidophila eiseniae]|uniref:Protein kinase domain-containing protein n=1 Tax=Candidatus Lumbricidiphila eiseniae TaxID=1969409 RepID=A0A2A6FQZ1_9MICO|nr:MAG: hypothetical protein B5766_06740 [Candidatus Lumbricidophila eiseniae]